MNAAHAAAAAAAVLLAGQWAAAFWLERLNTRFVRAHADAVPDALQNIVEPAAYAKSIKYTIARSRYDRFELTWDAAVLALILFSGLLPWGYYHFTPRFGFSAPAMASFAVALGIALWLADLPLAWRRQFRLEARFGFNTTTTKVWITDRAKELALSIVIGWPILALIFKLAARAGAWWWLWAWICTTAFQAALTVLAPALILPLFNTFSPLPEGPLRERLLKLGQRTGFRATQIQVMDGSRRSRHSNAFFTGFGRFRRIVLFDTLISQLAEPELEAVLAHEIGHYKKRHVPIMLAASALTTLAGFYVLSWLARADWFCRAFRFDSGGFAPALLIFGLLAGTVMFWLAPLGRAWSRHCEYQADAYAVRVMNEARSLAGALRKLHEENLSNLTPHPWYIAFYYSHPALLERERAMHATAEPPADREILAAQT